MRWILALFGGRRKRRMTPSRRLDATIAYRCLLAGQKSASRQRPIWSLPPNTLSGRDETMSPSVPGVDTGNRQHDSQE